MNKNIIIKEKQKKEIKKDYLLFAAVRNEKEQIQCLIFGLDLMSTQPNQNSLNLPPFRQNPGQGREVFICFYTHCGSNSKGSEQERSISHNLHITIKNVEV